MNPSNVLKKIDFMFWMRVHRLPRMFTEWWQLRELKRTVVHAYQRIPFYRKLYDAHGILPEDIRTLDDIRRLPVISKKQFRQYPLDEIMDAIYSGRFSWKETSGSTGEPFRFPSNASRCLFVRFGDMYKVNDGLHFTLFLEWQGISSKYAAENMKFAEIRVHNQPRFRKFLHIPVSDLRENPDCAVQRIKEFAPDVINSRATVLVELARLCAKLSPEERPRIPYMISHGETLTPAQRKYIKEIFGREPYNRYGLEEVGSVAVECEKHCGGHIHEESFIIEILDKAGDPLPEGSTGRIVLTYFYNDVMPFVRYDTGDQGKILPGLCGCGIRARRLSVDGRKGGFLTIGSKKFNNVEFEVLLSNFSDNILRYQVAKVPGDKIEVRIIPTENFFDDEQKLLKDQFREKFGLVPRVRFVSDIAYTKNGKTRFIIDET